MNAPFKTAPDLQVDAEMHVHALLSTVDGLKRIAAMNPSAVRSTSYFLAQASDELSELLAKIRDVE